MEGVYYLFVPDLSKFFDLNIWIAAANQVIFVLSLGMGINLMLSKYRNRTESCMNSSLFNCFSVLFFGLFCAIINFFYLGNLSLELNIPVGDLPIAGSDLAFITYPAALSLLPFSNIWSIIFFLMLITLGIDSQVRNKMLILYILIYFHIYFISTCSLLLWS